MNFDKLVEIFTTPIENYVKKDSFMDARTRTALTNFRYSSHHTNAYSFHRHLVIGEVFLIGGNELTADRYSSNKSIYGVGDSSFKSLQRSALRNGINIPREELPEHNNFYKKIANYYAEKSPKRDDDDIDEKISEMQQYIQEQLKEFLKENKSVIMQNYLAENTSANIANDNHLNLDDLHLKFTMYATPGSALAVLLNNLSAKNEKAILNAATLAVEQELKKHLTASDLQYNKTFES